MSGAPAWDASVPCPDCGHSETKTDFAHDGTANAEPASALSCSEPSETVRDAADTFRPPLIKVPNTNEAQTSAYVATPPAAPVIYGGNTAAMANNYAGSIFTQGSAYGSSACAPDAAGKDAFLKFSTPGSKGVSADVEVEISSLDASFDQTIAVWDATPISAPSSAPMSNDTRHAAFLASIGAIDDDWVVKRAIMSSLMPGALTASLPRVLANDDIQDLGDPVGKRISVAGATNAPGIGADFAAAVLGCGTSDAAADMIYKLRPTANTTLRAAARDPSTSSFVPAVAIIRDLSAGLSATSLGCSTGGSVDAQVTANIDYYIIVKGSSERDAGAYNLTVTDIGAVQDFGCETELSAPDAYFDFSVRADARDISISLNEAFGKLDGSFQLMRDLAPLDDFTNDIAVGPCQTRTFTYRELSAGRYYVVLRGSAAATGAGRLPAELTIRDESGLNALDCTDVDASANGKIVRKLAAGSRYYAGITTRNGAAGGSYSLQIRDTSVSVGAPDPVTPPRKVVYYLSGAASAICPDAPLAGSEDVMRPSCETASAAIGYGYSVYDPQCSDSSATLLHGERAQPSTDVDDAYSAHVAGTQAPTMYQGDTTNYRESSQ